MPRTASSLAPLLCFGGIIVGLAAILAGAAWSIFVKPTNVWSQEQAREFEAANDELHSVRAKFGPAAGGAIGQEEITAAQERFSRINSQLESARSTHDRLGMWIAGGGFALALACGLGLMVTRESSERA